MTRPRARRPVLPALAALLAGALVAGTATVLAHPGAASAGEPIGRNLARADTRSSGAHGDLNRPAPEASSSAPSTSGAPTTSSTPPSTSSATPLPPASTSPADPPPTAAPPAPPNTSQQDRVVMYVNAFRDRAGCGPVVVDSRLTAAAQGHSSDMSNRGYFSHTTPEGVTFDQRIRNAGHPSPGAENIARGARDAEDVMRLWMESSGHRANILNCDLGTIGVGLDRDGFYWVQDFGY
ncbi:MAG: CAP domain-containing protein [Pseudonocardiaceae bacterium]|nr:CAP domain-containing protein [Pseudonocardiaceae bacterium]